MRRSLCPSQKGKNPQLDISNRTNNNIKKNDNDKNTVISRLPLFGFLEIPDNLNKQFILPAGQLCTKKNLELRKIRTLGPNKNFTNITTLSGNIFKPKPIIYDFNEEDDDDGAEELPDENRLVIEPLVLWEDPNDSTNKIEVIYELASKLRPHQREGVQFLFECTMGLRGFDGEGCILADDMGLGKTLMSITLMWTLLNQGMIKGEVAAKKIMIVCPTSLVGNWDNEIRKWVGDKCNVFAVKSDPKKMIKSFINHRGKGVIIISYETQRRYETMFQPSKQNSGDAIALLICDEAHKLKNADSGLSKSLSIIPAKKRILLSGTPMQNELLEFFNMVDFCNPGVLGTNSEFRKKYERPILRAKELDANPNDKIKADKLQKELSTIVNEFILKRGNILNAQHLPPKLMQYVCCKLSPLQVLLYEHILNKKDLRHIMDGKQTDTLSTIRLMINICSHPRMIVESYKAKIERNEQDKELEELITIIRDYERENPSSFTSNKGQGSSGTSKFNIPSRIGNLRTNNSEITNKKSSILSDIDSMCSNIDPTQSGKLLVLFRLMQTMRALKQNERIVIVSNYTQTLDFIGQMCKEHGWPTLRLDGTVAPVKRTKLVDEFNNPFSGAFAFLLSSKAGGCGINLIGGNRLVLFDPDWNPASDKQAAGRIWREGQKRRCYIYRFMSTGTIEEKIIQRQLSKEGLMNIVDDKDQLNEFSTIELKGIFNLRIDTRSDTHDTLRCKRCSSVQLVNINTEKNKLNTVQIELCSKFLNNFSDFLASLVNKDSNIENQKLFFADDLTTLNTELLQGNFPTLPLFSRRLRLVIAGLEELEIENKTLPLNISINEEFLNKWSEVVPMLNSAITKVSFHKKINADDCLNGVMDCGENEDEIDNDDEYVEQEGMPDETDFNKWSHHCSVNTCDDSSLKSAMSDDNVISFLFGLEVNWSLLIANELKNKEKEEIEKEEKRLALIELNEKRDEKRNKDKENKKNKVKDDNNEINIENNNNKSKLSSTKVEKSKDKNKDNDDYSNSSDDDYNNVNNNDYYEIKSLNNTDIINEKVIDFEDKNNSSDDDDNKNISNSVEFKKMLNNNSNSNNNNNNNNKSKRKIISDEDEDEINTVFSPKIHIEVTTINKNIEKKNINNNEKLEQLNNNNNIIKKKERINVSSDKNEDDLFDSNSSKPSSILNNNKIIKGNNKDKDNNSKKDKFEGGENKDIGDINKENIINNYNSNNNNNNNNKVEEEEEEEEIKKRKKKKDEKILNKSPNKENCSPYDKSEWLCSLCTFINQDNVDNCIMCNEKKPKAKSSRRSINLQNEKWEAKKLKT